jgi:hypothetical protein
MTANADLPGSGKPVERPPVCERSALQFPTIANTILPTLITLVLIFFKRYIHGLTNKMTGVSAG